MSGRLLTLDEANARIRSWLGGIVVFSRPVSDAVATGWVNDLLALCDEIRRREFRARVEAEGVP